MIEQVIDIKILMSATDSERRRVGNASRFFRLAVAQTFKAERGNAKIIDMGIVPTSNITEQDEEEEKQLLYILRGSANGNETSLELYNFNTQTETFDQFRSNLRCGKPLCLIENETIYAQSPAMNGSILKVSLKGESPTVKPLNVGI